MIPNRTQRNAYHIALLSTHASLTYTITHIQVKICYIHIHKILKYFVRESDIDWEVTSGIGTEL